MGLAQAESLVVSQKKDWGEIIAGFEQANKYSVNDNFGNEMYFAAEVGGNFFARQFLRSLRPFTVKILAPGGQEALTLKRPFKFFFFKLEILDATGKLLGTIQKRWSCLRRILSVYDAQGNEAYQLFGPIFHPWTFEIRKDGQSVGQITKKWSGMLKEAFTTADNFGVIFPPGIDVNMKSILLGAVFLIDFAYFEKHG